MGGRVTQDDIDSNLDSVLNSPTDRAGGVREAHVYCEVVSVDALQKKVLSIGDQKVSFFLADPSQSMNRTRRTFKNIF